MGVQRVRVDPGGFVVPLDSPLGPIAPVGSGRPIWFNFFVARRLASELDEHAKAILAIKVSTVPRMPDSPLQEPLSRAGGAVTDSFGFIGGHIQAMSTTTLRGEQNFAEMERTNAVQLDKYLAGQAVVTK
ncbi:hypothetical protein [Nocardia sp. NPDC049149]|uniref:hypothetical protein n=1 Tax=Nocardia sp. NPDC049149 TaxID=3364315 RepID=UPI003716B07B